jgi:hypothetical protein
MQEDMKRQEGENCRKAGDILVGVFKLSRSFFIDVDPVLRFLMHGIRPYPGRFERSRS